MILHKNVINFGQIRPDRKLFVQNLSRRVFVGPGDVTLRVCWVSRVLCVMLDNIVVDKFWTKFWRFGQIWTTILGFVQRFWTCFRITLYNSRNTIPRFWDKVCEFCTWYVFGRQICLVFQVYLWYNRRTE